MALRSASDLVARLQGVERALSPAAQRARLQKVAAAVKPLATRAAAADLGGDAAFSGWGGKGGGRIPLTVRFTMHGGGSPSLTIHRDGRSAGPWRVAEEGRNQGNAGGFSGPGIGVSSGVTARTKSGAIRKVRARKARRWNGTTAGKGTWTDAVNLMEPKAKALFVKISRDEVARAAVGGLL